MNLIIIICSVKHCHCWVIHRSAKNVKILMYYNSMSNYVCHGLGVACLFFPHLTWISHSLTHTYSHTHTISLTHSVSVTTGQGHGGSGAFFDSTRLKHTQICQSNAGCVIRDLFWPTFSLTDRIIKRELICKSAEVWKINNCQMWFTGV